MRLSLIYYFSIILLIPLVSAQFPLKCLTNDLPKSVIYELKTSDDMTISVEERGDISKPTIIFTHGFFSNKLIWETTFTSIKMFEKYHLVRWDLRGMGDSSKDNDVDKYNKLELYAKDVELIINNIKEKKGKKDDSKIILVTWSTGSVVTLSYLNITGDSNVNGYVSVGNNFINFQTDNVFTEYSKVIIGSIVTSQTYLLILDSLNNLIKSFTSLNSQFPLQPSILSFFLGIGAYAPSESRLAYGEFEYDYTETFKNLLIPTLNIFGNDDRVVSPVHSQTIANLRPVDGLNHIVAYDAVGHIPMWENPKEFETDLDDWIKKSVLNPKHQKTPKTPKIPQPPPQPQKKRK